METDTTPDGATEQPSFGRGVAWAGTLGELAYSLISFRIAVGIGAIWAAVLLSAAVAALLIASVWRSSGEHAD